MRHLRIRNWEKYQTISGNKASYVQVQTDILLDMDFMGLGDRERLCFLLLLALAGRTMNKLPADPAQIMHVCHTDDPPDIEQMIAHGLLEEWSEEKHADLVEQEEKRLKNQRERKRKSRRQSGVTGQSQGGHSVTPAMSRLETETETETETEKKHMCKSDDSHNGFSEFWDAYPRKTNKKRAESAWRRLGKRDRDAALQDIGSRDWPTDPQYIPHGSTYLNGRRWEDEMPEQPKEVYL